MACAAVASLTVAPNAPRLRPRSPWGVIGIQYLVCVCGIRYTLCGILERMYDERGC